MLDKNRAHSADRRRTDVRECKKRKRNRRIVLRTSVFLIIVLTIIFELFFYDYVKKMAIMGTTCAFLLMIVKTFLEVAKQKNVYSDFDQYDFCQAAIDGFKDCCKIWKSKPIFTFLLITVIIWDSAVFLSQINTCARIAYAAEESVKAGIEALLNYERETNAKPIGKQNVPEVSVSISTSILLSEEK